MPYAEREFACPDCGRQIFRRAPENAVVRCLEHAIARSIDNMRQMMSKSGPDYDRWRARTALSTAQMAGKHGPVYERYLAGLARFVRREQAASGYDFSVSDDAARWGPWSE